MYISEIYFFQRFFLRFCVLNFFLLDWIVITTTRNTQLTKTTWSHHKIWYFLNINFYSKCIYMNDTYIWGFFLISSCICEWELLNYRINCSPASILFLFFIFRNASPEKYCSQKYVAENGSFIRTISPNSLNPIIVPC